MPSTSEQLKAFARLGQIIQIGLTDFAESITDPEVLSDLRDAIEVDAGKIDRVYDVSLDGDTFSGKAEQKLSLAKSRVFDFRISPTQIYFKPINSVDLAEYADTDQGWLEIVEYAATAGRAGKKLNCKLGNYQCGGSCINGNRACRKDINAKQVALVDSALNKAKSTKKPKSDTKPKSKDRAKVPSKTSINQQGLDETRSGMVAVHGEKLVSEVESNVSRILNDINTGVYVRVSSPEIVSQILGDRFKSYFEAYGEDNPGMEWYSGERKKVEDRFMGIPQDAKTSDRPVYGYFGSRNFVDGASNNEVSKYGNIAIELKPEVKQRTTMSGSDSMNGTRASLTSKPSAASLASELWGEYEGEESDESIIASAKTRDKLSQASQASDIDDLVSKTKSEYIEAQIYGQVTPDDIKALHFRSVGDPITPEVKKIAKDKGIDIYLDGVKQND